MFGDFGFNDVFVSRHFSFNEIHQAFGLLVAQFFTREFFRGSRLNEFFEVANCGL